MICRLGKGIRGADCGHGRECDEREKVGAADVFVLADTGERLAEGVFSAVSDGGGRMFKVWNRSVKVFGVEVKRGHLFAGDASSRDSVVKGEYQRLVLRWSIILYMANLAYPLIVL